MKERRQDEDREVPYGLILLSWEMSTHSSDYWSWRKGLDCISIPYIHALSFWTTLARRDEQEHFPLNFKQHLTLVLPCFIFQKPTKLLRRLRQNRECKSDWDSQWESIAKWMNEWMHKCLSMKTWWLLPNIYTKRVQNTKLKLKNKNIQTKFQLIQSTC